jgi:LacI family transcriptional regulator
MERIAAPEGSRRTIRLDAAIVERESCGRPR